MCIEKTKEEFQHIADIEAPFPVSEILGAPTLLSDQIK